MVCSNCGGSMAASAPSCPSCGHPSSASTDVTRLLTSAEAAASPARALADDEATRLSLPQMPALSPRPPSADDVTRLAIPEQARVALGSISGAAHSAIAQATDETVLSPVGATPPPAATMGTRDPAGAAHHTGPLQPGTPFGRYILIRLLGRGGMGSVYQAWDQELGLVVAIKVIRPDVMANPADARELERRFKRELLLARNVTNKHVIRIHDLGEIDGIKYITMPYVNGSDLATILTKERRLPLSRALAFARQIATGLVAAHESEIVHRDLKPANILIDDNDHAFITDFGISTSVGKGGGATMVGSVVGTLAYMAPEQARAESVDHRADIYAFGLMLSDMLTGPRERAMGDSAFADLIDRIGKPIPSMRILDPSLPEPLDAIVARCCHPDPAERYQRTQDLLADLDAVATDGQTAIRQHLGTATTSRTAPGTAARPAAPAARARTWLAASAIVLVAVTAGIAYWNYDSGAPGAAGAATAVAQARSLAVLPFRNGSSGSVDSLGAGIEQVIVARIGQSSALRTVPTGRIAQLLDDLKIAKDTNLDDATVGRLADHTNADMVLTGTYTSLGGNAIQISATLQDIKNDRSIELQAQAKNQDDLFPAVDRLVASVRQNLSLSSGAVRQLEATAFAPSTKNVTALRSYTEGMDFFRAGKHEEALARFDAATKEDEGFALAFSKLAQTYVELGRQGDAERMSLQAASLAESLQSQEKYLVLASHARILNERRKAIEHYEQFEKAIPDNDEVLLALGTLYRESGSFDNARARYTRLLENDPKSIDALVGAASVELGSGNASGALNHLRTAQQLSTELGNEVARATVLRAMGIAYRSLEKPDEAQRFYQDALDANRKLRRPRGIADTLHALAEAESASGKRREALAHYQEALTLRRQINDQQGIGNLLIDMSNVHADGGDYKQALDVLEQALTIQRAVGNQPFEALALNNIADIYRAWGDYEKARTYLQQALGIREKLDSPRDIADSLHNLGENHLWTGDLEAAQGDYLKALDIRRKITDKTGEAIEQNSLGTVLEYQGRYQASRESRKQAVDTYRGTGEKGLWLARLLAAQAGTLIASEQSADAQPLMDEARALAGELKNDELTAELQAITGERLLFAEDYKGARTEFQRALELAQKGQLRMVELRSRLALQKIDIQEGRARAAVPALKRLVEEADRQGLRYIATECRLYLGRALIEAGQQAAALDLLTSALAQADRLGARVLRAKANHLLAKSYEASGKSADAIRHRETAKRQLEDIRKEAGTDAILTRSDLRPLSA
jgi:tetratricopeptide (TPR) repeat protein